MGRISVFVRVVTRDAIASSISTIALHRRAPMVALVWMESAHSHVCASMDLAVTRAPSTSTNVIHPHVLMVPRAMIMSTRTRAHAHPDFRAPIVNLMTTIAHQVRA